MIRSKRGLVALLTLLAFAFGAWRQTSAQEAVIVSLDFDDVRQGNAGIVTLSGPNVIGATATAFGHIYPFYPTSNGFACLLSVPMGQKIQSYPLTITMTGKDGSEQHWNGAVKVASGQFIQEMPFNLPSEKLYLLNDNIQTNEDSRLLSIYSVVTPIRYWQGAFTMPINSAFSSPFGTFRLFNDVAVRRHTGQDLHATTGTPVLASADGRVVFSRSLDIHGESIIIDHGWGVFSEYSHLSARYVVPGQFVLQGNVIGLSGGTGRATGPVVHWEIAVNGNWVDPIDFIRMKLPE